MTSSTPDAPSTAHDPRIPVAGDRVWVDAVLRELLPLSESARWRWIGSELAAGPRVEAVLEGLWRHREHDGGDPGQVAATVALLARDEVWISEMLVDGPVAVAARLASGRGLDLVDHDMLVDRFPALPRAVAAAVAVNPRLRRRPELAQALIGRARRALGPRTAARMLPALPTAWLARHLPELMHLSGLEWRAIARHRPGEVLAMVAADLDDTPTAVRDRWWDQRGFPAAVGVVRAHREQAAAVLDLLEARGPADRAPAAWLWRADLAHAAPARAAAYLLAPSRAGWLARHRPSRAVSRVLPAHGEVEEGRFGALRPFGRAPGAVDDQPEPGPVVLPAWGATRRDIVDLARTHHDQLPAFLAHVGEPSLHGDGSVDGDDADRWHAHPLPTATWLAVHRRALARALQLTADHSRPRERSSALVEIAAGLQEVPVEVLLAMVDEQPAHERAAILAGRRSEPDVLLRALLGRTPAVDTKHRAAEIAAAARWVGPARAGQLLAATREQLPPASTEAAALNTTGIALRLQGWLGLLDRPAELRSAPREWWLDDGTTGVDDRRPRLRRAIKACLDDLGEPGDPSVWFNPLWNAARQPNSRALLAHELSERGPLGVPLLARPMLKGMVAVMTEPLSTRHPDLAQRLAGRWLGVPDAEGVIVELMDRVVPADQEAVERLEGARSMLDHGEPLLGLEYVLTDLYEDLLSLFNADRERPISAARAWNTRYGFDFDALD
ncbi:hypothetical protein [Actinomycetospora soli]|uniref:hypothetical protein n=1 Tax=Actinomycetospora soli TaxID=2893887 RepID=UPI001E34F320|nr:hypothetical protein [Actinomycetospora soli]MCD2191249.1 hypothetical protein [Actinomycetospora soli]